MVKTTFHKLFRLLTMLPEGKFVWEGNLEKTIYFFSDADGKISVKFGVLFNDEKCANLFEALVGTLRAAKRKKIITFQGELLLQGVHDDVDVILL